MSEYITTYTGKYFNPTQPNPDLISIQDIAHALSLICRGNGHVQTFWSVGQHCICCAKEAAARGLSDRMVLACLLHDASECYMSDVPTPFKKELSEYQEQEEHLLRMIYEKFLGSTLTSGEQAQLKEIDHAMLLYDLENLLGEVQYGEIPDLQIDLDYTVRPFTEVEDEYLMLFAKYSGTAASKAVYLEDIADAFEECMDGWAQFLDTRTGKLLLCRKIRTWPVKKIRSSGKKLMRRMIMSDCRISMNFMRKVSWRSLRMRLGIKEFLKYCLMRSEEGVHTGVLKIK